MLSLGIDTGGTYTDAVLLDRSGQVVNSTKCLTTHGELIEGIRAAITSVVAGRSKQVELVSLSTTLATNAIVEGMYAPAGLVMIGTDPLLAARAGLHEALGKDPLLSIRGGHDASGSERSPLDLRALEPWISAHKDHVSAFAVCAEFGVMNPVHELSVRDVLRRRTHLPVTCAHELSSRLNAPRRALTALLNARLLSRITDLVNAVEAVLHETGVTATLMVVKGDGSLVHVDLARERPVETILSGPAASVVGASHLAPGRDLFVADIGGTTTDIAILRHGKPRLDPRGASVGGFRTMVNAVAVHSVGLGGDSMVSIGPDATLRLGPRRVTPICRLCTRHGHVMSHLDQLDRDRAPALDDLRFVWRQRLDERLAGRLRGEESRLWQRVSQTPVCASVVAPDRYTSGILDRLINRGVLAVGSLTPTDAAHALGLQSTWSIEASIRLLESWQRMLNASGTHSTCTADGLAHLVLERLGTSIGLAILDCAFATEPAPGVGDCEWGGARRLLEHALSVSQRSNTELFSIRPALTLPLVAVGASAAIHFPRVQRGLEFDLEVPSHAEVTNAVGAVVGSVIQSIEIRITSPAPGVFRIHGGVEQDDHSDLPTALEVASERAQLDARSRAVHAGALDPEVSAVIERQHATVPGGGSIFIEAIVRATARGRPAYAM